MTQGDIFRLNEPYQCTACDRPRRVIVKKGVIGLCLWTEEVFNSYHNMVMFPGGYYNHIHVDKSYTVTVLDSLPLLIPHHNIKKTRDAYKDGYFDAYFNSNKFTACEKQVVDWNNIEDNDKDDGAINPMRYQNGN